MQIILLSIQFFSSLLRFWRCYLNIYNLNDATSSLKFHWSKYIHEFRGSQYSHLKKIEHRTEFSCLPFLSLNNSPSNQTEKVASRHQKDKKSGICNIWIICLPLISWPIKERFCFFANWDTLGPASPDLFPSFCPFKKVSFSKKTWFSSVNF